MTLTRMIKLQWSHAQLSVETFATFTGLMLERTDASMEPRSIERGNEA